MKRSRRHVESHLEALRRKRARIADDLRRVDELIADKARELAALDLIDAEARAVTVPWPAFERAVWYTRKAWKDVDVTDVYAQHGDCDMTDTCWYSGNMDRLDGLELVRLETLDGVAATLCDVCMANSGRERVLRHIPARSSVRVDPDDYEPDIAGYLRKAACGEDVEDIELKDY